MQKRNKHYFLHSVLCLALLQLSAAAATAFQYDICINGADSPSLTFGVGTKEQQPAPPYSGMFGVLDIHLMNVGEVTEDPGQKWMKRLTKDIRTDAEMGDQRNPQAWYIFAKNNASLKFNLATGSTPEPLQIRDVDEDKPQKIENGMTLPVKTGRTYKIFYQYMEPQTPAPKDENVIIVENSKETPVVRPITNPILQTIEKIFVDFNAGIGSIGYDGEPNVTPDWVVKISRGTAKVTYNWLILGKRLEVTLTVTTRAAGDMEIVMTPKKQNIPPVETRVVVPENTDTETKEQIVDTAQWIPKAYGTIDFDGNGVIDMNDAMYFYKFALDGFPTDDPYYTGADIAQFADTQKMTEGELNNTLNILKENLQILNLAENPQKNMADMNDVMYLYKFILDGCPSNDKFYTGDDVITFSNEQLNDELKNTLIQNLKNLYNESIK